MWLFYNMAGSHFLGLKWQYFGKPGDTFVVVGDQAI